MFKKNCSSCVDFQGFNTETAHYLVLKIVVSINALRKSYIMSLLVARKPADFATNGQRRRQQDARNQRRDLEPPGKSQKYRVS